MQGLVVLVVVLVVIIAALTALFCWIKLKHDRMEGMEEVLESVWRETNRSLDEIQLLQRKQESLNHTINDHQNQAIL